MASDSFSFLSGSNAAFLADLYSRYLADPDTVDPSFQQFFASLGEDGRAVARELGGASWGLKAKAQREPSRANGEARPAPEGIRDVLSEDQIRQATRDSIAALLMIRVYRVRGHLIAKFDPLGLEGAEYHPELDPKAFGFTDADMDRPIFLDKVLGFDTATLREILALLKETYCGKIGVQYMHIQDSDQRNWIMRRVEGIRNHTDFTVKGKVAIYERLLQAEGFENFLHVKYTGTKRFGLDGGESTIAAIEQILKRGGQLGVREVVIGMPHRGRLNVLVSVMLKPYRAIFSEFQGGAPSGEAVEGSGDVKYHLGTSADRDFDGHPIHLSLTANPSHLEAVNPVTLGKVRAKQAQQRDSDRMAVAGLLLHGDAAFAGQGLVPETLAMSQLSGYRTGGTIHFIVNNQIGFTTAPSKSRSSPYPSDVALGIQAPIFHVNGDDPEAVVHVARLATEFRQEFKRDVVIDMFCYRRHGHNEADEPSFTQPLMYKAIGQHPTTRQIYEERLIQEGVLTRAKADKMMADFRGHLEREFESASDYKPNKADWLEGTWKGLVRLSSEEELHEDDTSVPLDLLKEVGIAISTPPGNFNVNPKIVRQLNAKRKMIETGADIDWATAEALAFGTLMCQGKRVRLSGQDSGRGTFSHRHAVLVDQETEAKYVPLDEIRKDQATFEVLDSPLSEAGVLGFEYGYSLADPETLVLWEAQFGDVANGAQVIIDQFIAAGETKWKRMSGVVLLLPHGYEGQGPEHSSARVERFLQLCAEDNLQVVNCTTPANYFHVLRRQMFRNFRKPLVVMSPKSLLRHKLVVSALKDMAPGTRFYRVLPETDALAADAKVRRVVLCSGKVYYDLLEARRERKINDVALVRVEQLYPWPRQTVMAQIKLYPNADVVWCQEEPANMGSWMFVCPRLQNVLDEAGIKATRPLFVGRKAAASPATGSLRVHQQEQAQLVERALTGQAADLPQPFQRPACAPGAAVAPVKLAASGNGKTAGKQKA